MERQPIIDLSVSVGAPRSGTLLLEEPPPPPVAAAPPLEASASGLRVWAWRAAVAIVVLLAVAGLAAFASTPPPV